MPDVLHQDQTQNRILSRLSSQDFGLLEPWLNTIELPLRTELEAPHQPIKHAYFIERGFASVVASGGDNRGLEVGLIGREGMTGVPLIMGTDRSPNATYIQSAGRGQRIASADLNKTLDESPTLRRALLNFGHTFLVQATYTAVANGRSKVETRLARWLLMAHDRTDGDELTLTHEFLAIMLGVRRPGVTVALSFLEKQGLVRAQRGAISIIDRKGLEEAANDAYGAPEAELRRLFD